MNINNNFPDIKKSCQIIVIELLVDDAIKFSKISIITGAIETISPIIRRTINSIKTIHIIIFTISIIFAFCFNFICIITLILFFNCLLILSPFSFQPCSYSRFYYYASLYYTLYINTNRIATNISRETL